ncbi:actin-like protein ARP6 [Syncephalis pseudoplumigaleata]|uniref:Actin-like protein ARP6 n=1 Tax=Syncephalis pseudoplumigaleata TaxID=1712513 RepID=A0A4P9Z5A4_9FUNG|nr:actin-like protein ARP6 [Syncephalis pseudoplumigaleata]|eukprot:RKP27628.1 actin-like protein ARP6 [Syncephalis pseudoplumigaleata]
MATDRTLAIVDNGAYTIKAGVVGEQDGQPRIVPNCLAKLKGGRAWLVADELDRAHNYAGLYYRLPFEKGILVDWDVERMVWERLFSSNVLKCEPTNTWLWLTEPCLNLPNVQAAYDQVIFEEFEFDGYSRQTGNCRPATTQTMKTMTMTIIIMMPVGTTSTSSSSSSSSIDDERDCVLVVDIGYSSTQAIPFLHGQMILNAIRRLNVGGKFLTNHLKEMISFRQWNMMDETYLVNQIKETCCYVSADLYADLRICREDPRSNPIVQAYVLPDFVNTHQGYVKQVLWMNNERFTVPEALFHPSDIGMPQAGLAELIHQAVQATPEALHALLYANIVVVGGSAQYPGLCDRLSAELRQLVPADYAVRLAMPDEPATFAWQGMHDYVKRCSMSQMKEEMIVTRADYQEEGASVHMRRRRRRCRLGTGTTSV